MKVDGSLKSLLQGVSQQPPRDRLPGQCTLQENMSADPISGLTRRPATDLVNKLVTSANVRGWHDFDTKGGRKYLASLFINEDGKGDVRVYNLNGEERQVTVDDDARAYIEQFGDLRFNTIENDTYVANQGKAVKMVENFRIYFNRDRGHGVDGRYACLVQVLGGQYGRRYTIAVDGVEKAAFHTRDGSDKSHVDDIRTTRIAQALHEGLNSTIVNDGWKVSRKDDIILMYKDAVAKADQFNVVVSDDFGNSNIKVNDIAINKKEDLPRMAPHGFVCRIAERTDSEMDLWFRYVRDGTEEDDETVDDPKMEQGYWQETIAPDTVRDLDSFTMPHVLEMLSEAQETFRFRRVNWQPRRVGTKASNPNPSFIGNRINDVFTFQGRLGILSGPNVIMSRTNKEQDFWFGSISAQASTDPIDVRSKIEASTMQAAVQHNRDLVIFSNKGQFVMFGRTSLTPDNAALVLTSAFEAELRAKPVGAGRNVFFANNYGAFTGIREFFVESGTDINDSRSITQHVKRYIEGRVVKLSATSNYDTLLVQTDNDTKEMHQYQFIWKDNEKIQDAWSKYKFGLDIAYTFFDEELVYIIFRDGTNYYLHRMSLDVQMGDGILYHVHLDDRFDVYECYEQFYLPYDFLATDWKDKLVAVQHEDSPNPGLTVPIKSIELQPDGRYLVTLQKNMMGGYIVVGRRFRSAYRPTIPMVKDGDNIKVGTGNLTISRFRISLSKTGEIIGQTLSEYGNQEPVRFNGRIVGDFRNVVGEQPLMDTTFTLPFNHKADLGEIELSTESHLPMTLLDIEWEGQYTKRGKRIGSGGN